MFKTSFMCLTMLVIFYPDRDNVIPMKRIINYIGFDHSLLLTTMAINSIANIQHYCTMTNGVLMTHINVTKKLLNEKL